MILVVPIFKHIRVAIPQTKGFSLSRVANRNSQRLILIEKLVVKHGKS